MGKYSQQASWVDQAAIPGDQVVHDPDRGASVGTIAGASFMDDTDTKIKYFARNRFPDDPDAMTRYGVSEDGSIYYIGDDGKAYAEVPDFDYADLTSYGQHLAGSVGKLPVNALAIGTGVGTAPMWLAGPAGAAANVMATSGAAMGGEYIRQSVGNYLAGDPYDVDEVLHEGAWNALPELVGGAVGSRLANRTARDLHRLDRRAASEITEKAQREGIDMTVGQKTGLRSQLNREKVLANLEDSSMIMDDFYEAQRARISQSVGRHLDNLSTVDSAEEAGEMLRDAASDYVKKTVAARAAQASPLYKEAFATAPKVNTYAVLNKVDEMIGSSKGPVKQRLRQVQRFLMTTDEAGENVADTSLENLHGAKVAIDDLLSRKADGSMGRISRQRLMEVKELLLRQMDEASPKYAEARNTFRDMSPDVDFAREGLIGKVAGADDTKLTRLVDTILNPGKTGPNTVRKIKTALKDTNPEAWQAAKRSYLQNAWVKASKEYATSKARLAGPKFRAAVYGDDYSRETLKAMLEPQEWNALKDLFDVIEATSRSIDVNSDTAWKQLAEQEFRRDAGRGFVGTAIDPMQWLRRTSDWFAELRVGRHAEKLAQIVTSPDGIARVKELKRLPKNSLRRAIGVAQLVGAVPNVVSDETGSGSFYEAPQPRQTPAQPAAQQ